MLLVNNCLPRWQAASSVNAKKSESKTHLPKTQSFGCSCDPSSRVPKSDPRRDGPTILFAPRYNCASA